MSRTISIFVKHPDISKVVECVSRVIGHSVIRVESVHWELYSTQTFGFNLSIFRADDFEDDQGILFSRYSIVVDLHNYEDWFMMNTTKQFRRSASFLLARRLVESLNCECMVVEDTQRLLAIFPQPIQ